jgi:outer membrane protein
MKRLTGCACVWAFLMGVFPASIDAGQAQKSTTPLSLEQAIGIAVKENANISAARSRLKASEERIVQARSGLFPQINFNQSFNRTTNPMWAFGTKLNQEVISSSDFDPVRLNDPDAIDNFSSTFSVSWSLFDQGRNWIGWRQAKLDSTATSCAMDRVRQQIIARTILAYVGLRLAHENLSVVQKTLETARTHLKMVQSRFENGFVVKSDLLRAQVHIAGLEQEHFQAESRVAVAQAVLSAVMGVSEDHVYEPVSPLDVSETLSGSLEQWIEKALSLRADYRRLQYQESIAKEEIKKARAAHLPAVSLMGNYEMNSEDFKDHGENYTIGAVMRLNLFSGQRLSAKTREAKASLAEVAALKQDFEQQVRVEVRQAFFEALSAGKRIKVARTAIAQAEEVLRIVRNRYSSGLLTIVELLDAEVAMQKAQTDHLKSMHDYKAAMAQLYLAAGSLDENFH